MFLHQLETFSDFTSVFNSANYSEIPEDWLVVATDVTGSTKAIESGKYKEVNTIGATCIIACVNACKPAEICYQFGGDGAFVVSPPEKLTALTEALVTCQKIARTQFKLRLRVQIWPYKAFKSHGARLNVIKYRVGSKQNLFMFSGRAIELSDEWLKGEAAEAGLVDHNSFKDAFVPEVTAGLECRWNPLVSRRGRMVTAIVKPLVEDVSLLHELYELINDFGDGNSRLIQDNNIRTTWPPKHYYTEWRVRTAHLKTSERVLVYIRTLAFVLLVTPIVWLLRSRIPYIRELKAQTDFEKYDGTLRFVRDLTEDEYLALRSRLDALLSEKKVVYGLHQSRTALMTCMVMDTDEDHLHFIDGNDGGYAMAAKELKSQILQLQKIATSPS